MTSMGRSLLSGTGPLTIHFQLEEFACHCSVGRALIAADLVEVLEEIRCVLNAPVRIVSGYRCPVRNATQGGTPRSWHTVGLAADVAVAPELRTQLGDILVALVKAGRLRYVETHETFTHVDVGFG